LRITLQGQHTFWDGGERNEGRGENYRQNSSIPWRPARADSQCRRWHNALDAAAEGHLQPLGGTARAAQKAWASPTCLHMLCYMHQLLFLLNYSKTKTLLTPWDNFKKTKIKKLKMPLTLGKKEVDLRGYAVIILHKKRWKSKNIPRH
jgi:hypothetical protein